MSITNKLINILDKANIFLGIIAILFIASSLYGIPFTWEIFLYGILPAQLTILAVIWYCVFFGIKEASKIQTKLKEKKE